MLGMALSPQQGLGAIAAQRDRASDEHPAIGKPVARPGQAQRLGSMGGALDCSQFRSPKAAAEQLELLYAGLPADRCHNTVTPASSGGIIVGNDNNLPFSAGRRFFQADSNELILLHVPEFLRAR